MRAVRADTGRATRLSLAVTAPAVAPAEPPLPGPPYPVVLLLNGFQARAGQYAPLARRLASWGFLVAQYTLPPLTIVRDSVELGFAGQVLAWLRRAAESEANPALHGRADLSRVLVAGHSRGAKLAALHYCGQLRAARQQQQQQTEQQTGEGEQAGQAGQGELTLEQKLEAAAAVMAAGGGGCAGASASIGSKGASPTASYDSDASAYSSGGGRAPFAAATPLPPLLGAFLADPVDNTDRTPESAAYPSACRALAEAGAKVAIAGAGVVGATNPEGANYKRFWASAAPGSWCGVLPRAGHTKWLQGPPAECWLLDWAFGGGAAPRRVVLEATGALAVAWFRRCLEEHEREASAAAAAAADGGEEQAAAGGGVASDPLASADGAAKGAPRIAVVAAAAVYGREGGSAGGSGGGTSAGTCSCGAAAAVPPLPPLLAQCVAGLVDAGDLELCVKGGCGAGCGGGPPAAHPLA